MKEEMHPPGIMYCTDSC